MDFNLFQVFIHIKSISPTIVGFFVSLSFILIFFNKEKLIRRTYEFTNDF